ncbi:HNH endonuclease [Nodosilinea sp. LEGE 07088]|uniref:HNH endonuclease n=1 Tax=Nodosilinea sp. LEGE 07088 TaxID=2777968 RepID=UPI0018804893|nr:HNH endonuclease [Nodosilinea sp. LEGE 07088]
MDRSAGIALWFQLILPYAKTGNNNPSNGILLRADIHILFDLNLLPIDPDTLKVFLHPNIQNTDYQSLHKKSIQILTEETVQPDQTLLRQRLKQCCWFYRE